RYSFGRAVFGQARTRQARGQLALQGQELLRAVALRTRTSLARVRTIVRHEVCGESGDPRHKAFQGFKFVLLVAAPVAFFVPSRVPVVAKDELRANAGCFASRARGLHVAQIAQEIDQPGEAL